MLPAMLINRLGSLKLTKVKGVRFDIQCFILSILIFVTISCTGILKINKTTAVFREKSVYLIYDHLIDKQF